MFLDDKFEEAYKQDHSGRKIWKVICQEIQTHEFKSNPDATLKRISHIWELWISHHTEVNPNWLFNMMTSDEICLEPGMKEYMQKIFKSHNK